MRVKIGKWSVAFGLDWIMPSSASEARRERKARAKSAYVLAQMDRQQWLGFHPPVKGVAYCGALLVAMVKPNAIVVHPLNEDEVWVCAVQDGMPVVGYDQIMPIANGRNTALEWSGLFVKADMVGDFAGAQGSFEDILSQIDQGIANKSIKKKQLAPALLHANGAMARRIAVLVLLMATVAAGVIGFRAYQDIQRRRSQEQSSALDAARAAMAELQGKAKQDGERKAQAAAFQQQVEAARTEQRVRVDPAQLWEAITQVRRSIPFSARGYKPQSIDCGPQSCRVQWIGSGRFVNVADKLLLPNVEPSYTTDLTATSVFPLKVAQGAMPASQPEIASAEQMRFWLYSALATKYVGINFDPAQPVMLTPPQGTGLQPASVASVGKWHVSMASGGLIEAAELARALSRWPVRITAVKFTNGSTVEIDGEYVFVGG